MKTCIISAIEAGNDALEIPLAYKDDHFVDTGGLKCRFMSVAGKKCFVVEHEYIGINMTMGQKLLEFRQPLNLGTDITGQVWLRRDSNPFEFPGWSYMVLSRQGTPLIIAEGSPGGNGSSPS